MMWESPPPRTRATLAVQAKRIEFEAGACNAIQNERLASDPSQVPQPNGIPVTGFKLLVPA